MSDAHSIPTLRQRDMLTVDDLFIKDGYVLDFSNPRYATFFREEVGIDIDDPRWSVEGGSKGKRLRYFLKTVEPALAVKALKALWGHRELQLTRSGQKDDVANAKARFDDLLVRLGEKLEPASATIGDALIKRPNYDVIHAALMSLTNRSPQERGYAFEKWLQKTFNVFGLEAEKSLFASLANRSMVAFISTATPIFWKQSGTMNGRVQEIFTLFMESWIPERHGRAVCLLATAALQKRG
jgi:hypothetical protein